MAKLALATDREVQAAPCVNGKPTDYSIKNAAGLRLRVMKSGTRTWSLIYTRKNGAKRRISLGEYPAMGLKDAKLEAGRLRAEAGKGGDLAAAQTKPSAQTIGELIPIYLEHYQTTPRKKSKRMRKPRTIEENARLLNNDVLPEWRDRAIGSIKRADVKALLNSLAANHEVKANRVLSAIRPLFKWAVGNELIEANPCADVDAPSPEVSRDRVLGDDELHILWEAAGKLGAREAAFVKVLAFTLQRRTEVSAMRWDEFDTKARTWLIPGNRTKNSREHLVPLVGPAIALVEGLKAAQGNEAEYVFGENGQTPLSHYSKIKVELDGHMVEAFSGRFDWKTMEIVEPGKFKPWRFHDLRRTGDTNMHRLKVPDTVVDKVLNHTMPGVRGIYNRYEYFDEKKEALEKWAAFLDRLQNGGSHVVE